MSNGCSHETLLHIGPPGPLWSICYYHQDLHPPRLQPGSHPEPSAPRERPAYSFGLQGQAGQALSPLHFPEGIGGARFRSRPLFAPGTRNKYSFYFGQLGSIHFPEGIGGAGFRSRPLFAPGTRKKYSFYFVTRKPVNRKSPYSPRSLGTVLRVHRSFQ